MSRRILVTGATGNAGTEVVKELQKRDAQIVVASRRQAEAGRPEDDAEVVFLDMNEPASYAAAVQGCDALFLLRPPSVANTKETLNVLIDEARKAGMRRIVFVSVAGAGDNKLVPHHATEQHLKAGHDDWTILRPGFFAQNIATAYRQDIVEHDRIYLPAGKGKVAFIDLRDMGVVAAEALTDLDHHGGETYTLTGPQAYTFYQVAGILSDALARAIRYRPGLHRRLLSAPSPPQDEPRPDLHPDCTARRPALRPGGNGRLDTGATSGLSAARRGAIHPRPCRHLGHARADRREERGCMMRFLKYAAIAIGGLFVVLIAAAGVLYVVEGGDNDVPATVMDDPSLPRLELDGYTFHAETFGDPANPTVVVLHGGPGGDYRSLLGLQALADEYLVVFYDQRGSGLSERVPPDQLSYQVMLEDVDRIVDHFGQGEPVHLVGHSWGGMLASGYLGYAPDKVDKAVLMEPGFLNADEAAEWRAYYGTLMSGLGIYWNMLRAGFAAMHVDGPDDYAGQDYLVGERILPLFVNHPDNPYHCPGEAYDAPHWRWGTAASNAVQGGATDADLDSLSAHAPDYDKPVLFLASACNTWIGPELQARHAALYPNSGLVVIPDAGHEMVWDNPDVTLNAIRMFLSD